jgi:hypothetical protein
LPACPAKPYALMSPKPIIPAGRRRMAIVWIALFVLTVR